MKVFELIKKRKKKEPMNITFDVSGYICEGCGRLTPMHYSFCTYCGTKNLSKPKNDQIKLRSPKQRNFAEEERYIVYLEKRNLLQLADRQYQINIMLENGTTVKVPLIGRQNSNDALNYLRKTGLLRADELYRFTNWPSVDPCIGPDYLHISACVCELDPNSTYYVKRFERKDIAVLYGCPNSKSITTHTVMDQAKVEIIDYEN